MARRPALLLSTILVTVVAVGAGAAAEGGTTTVAADRGVGALPATELATPSFAAAAAGQRDLLWTTAGRVRHQALPAGGSWTRAVGRGAGATSQPGAVSWGNRRLDVFVRGDDNRLRWRTRTSRGWSRWRALPGPVTSAPAATSWAPGRLDVFARGRGGALLHRTFAAGRWSRWRRRGGTLTSSPTAASWGPGRLDVVARATGGRLAHRSFTRGDGWSPWRTRGGRLTAQPAVAAPVPGRLDVVTRGRGGRLNVRSWTAGNGWAAPRRLGTTDFASGATMTTVDGSVLVAAQRADGAVALTRRAAPGRRWTAWRAVDALRPFRGMGTWVDVLDYPSLDPSTAVADMRARGVRTLLLSTGRFDSGSRFFDRAEMGQWLDAAHAANIRVVGWYVPGYGRPARDVRRTVAIARFRSPGGQRFDAIGVDIERFGPSGEVGRARFNARVVPHLRRVRRRTAAVTAAIVPSPFTTEPGNNWEGFPWRGVGAHSDVVVPMALWSKRANANGRPFSARQVRAWVAEQIASSRALTGLPVHVEGGVNDPGAENSPVTLARLRAFVAAVGDARAIGGSHYDYATTRSRQWSALAGLR
jgi:hypothetical protein